MDKQSIDLTGKIFGEWVVLMFSRKQTCGVFNYWWCKCACGSIKPVREYSLLKGLSKSCGCITKQNMLRAVTKHGKSQSIEYTIWSHIIDRCYNPKNKEYHRYGGRGVCMNDSWRSSFTSFLDDMGYRPDDYHIHRLDNNGMYSKDNCVWVSDAEHRRIHSRKGKPNPTNLPRDSKGRYTTKPH